jgi:hypothetical protein
MNVNGKMISVENIPGMGRGEDERKWWRRWIQVWYIQYIVRTFVNATMYHHPAQQLKKDYGNKDNKPMKTWGYCLIFYHLHKILGVEINTNMWSLRFNQ